MPLFTAEALIRASHRADELGFGSLLEVTRRACLRWLHTQGRPVSDEFVLSGWLVQVPGLHAQRAPVNTCLSALEACARNTEFRAENDSKGCGGVMRMAPVGLARDIDVFKTGCDLAAITHGHPTGQLAAGYFAEVVARLLDGLELEAAAEMALTRLGRDPASAETGKAVEAALSLARRGRPSAEAVESLGQGWVAEEALAIGLYCALVAEDFRHGVLLAVNHSGIRTAPGRSPGICSASFMAGTASRRSDSGSSSSGTSSNASHATSGVTSWPRSGSRVLTWTTIRRGEEAPVGDPVRGPRDSQAGQSD